MQVLKPLRLRADRQLIEHRFQFSTIGAGDEQGGHVAEFRREGWGSHPVSRRDFKRTALEMSVDDPLMLLGRKVILHGRVTKPRQDQVSA